MTNGSVHQEACRHAGCGLPRTALSVFCEGHHRQQLERAGSGVELRGEDVWRLVQGPLWLELTRGAAVGGAAGTMELRWAVVVIGAICVAGSVVGWFWSRRLVWREDLGFPVAHVPSAWFVVPIFAYCAVTAAVIGGIVRAIVL